MNAIIEISQAERRSTGGFSITTTWSKDVMALVPIMKSCRVKPTTERGNHQTVPQWHLAIGPVWRSCSVLCAY